MFARLTSTGGRLRPALVAICAGALVLGACGGGGGGGGSQTPDLGELEELLGDGDLEGLLGDADLDDLEGFDSLAPFGDDPCFSAFMALSAAFAGSFMPGADLEDSFEVLEEFASSAPAAIQDDFEILLGALNEFQRELADLGVDLADPSSFADPDVIDAFDGLGDPFDDPAVEQAGDNIEAYFDEVCADWVE